MFCLFTKHCFDLEWFSALSYWLRQSQGIVSLTLRLLDFYDTVYSCISFWHRRTLSWFGLILFSVDTINHVIRLHAFRLGHHVPLRTTSYGVIFYYFTCIWTAIFLCKKKPLLRDIRHKHGIIRTTSHSINLQFDNSLGDSLSWGCTCSEDPLKFDIHYNQTIELRIFLSHTLLTWSWANSARRPWWPSYTKFCCLVLFVTIHTHYAYTICSYIITTRSEIHRTHFTAYDTNFQYFSKSDLPPTSTPDRHPNTRNRVDCPFISSTTNTARWKRTIYLKGIITKKKDLNTLACFISEDRA